MGGSALKQLKSAMHPFFKAVIFFPNSKARIYGDARQVSLSSLIVFVKLFNYYCLQSIISFVLQVSVRVHKRKNTTKTTNYQGEAEWLVKRRRLVTSAASCSGDGAGPSMDGAHQESSRLWSAKQTKEMELQKSRRSANSRYLSHIISYSKSRREVDGISKT